MQLSDRHKKLQHHWRAAFRIAPLLAAVFLCAQILATAHSAAHADNDHLHDGVPCIIATASKQYDAMDLAGAGPEIKEISGFHAKVAGPSSAHARVLISIRSIRAPPSYS